MQTVEHCEKRITYYYEKYTESEDIVVVERAEKKMNEWLEKLWNALNGNTRNRAQEAHHSLEKPQSNVTPQTGGVETHHRS